MTLPGLQLTISDQLAEAGVSVTLGIVRARVEVRDGGDELGSLLDEVAETRKAALGEAPASQVPQIAATRQAYKKLGKDPSRYRPSAEALTRRVLQGKGLFRVSNVVDVNNLVSLETGHCAGTYDLDRLAPPVLLRAGTAGESYEAIGRGPLNIEGLPLLADATGPFGSPTSDSERSKIGPETRSLLMVVYGFGSEADVAVPLERTFGLLERYCAAQDIERTIVAGTA